ncbi:hypothetical protein, partial [Burkholderia pseudomallei]
RARAASLARRAHCIARITRRRNRQAAALFATACACGNAERGARAPMLPDEWTAAGVARLVVRLHAVRIRR